MIRPIRACLWLALCLPIGAWAAEPRAVIEGKSKVPAGASFLLDGSKSVSDFDLDWQVLQGEGFVATFDKGTRRNVALFFPAPEPGLYRFALVAIGEPSEKGGRPLGKVAVFEVEVGVLPPPAPTPVPVPVPPGPTPGPTPVPPAPVVQGKLWVSYIVDNNTLTPEQAAVRSSTTASLWPAFGAHGKDKVTIAQQALGHEQIMRLISGWCRL